MEDYRLQWADKITLERIGLMHPLLRDELLEEYLVINTALAKGIRLRFAQTLRTKEEQDELYAQGRTKPGKIVTNAPSLSSWHNYGLAFDIVILYDLDGNGSMETASWDEKKDYDKNGIAEYKQVTDFFKSKGWFWGGDFKSIVDTPHFEKTFGLSIGQARGKYNSGDTFIDTSNGKKYINIK